MLHSINARPLLARFIPILRGLRTPVVWIIQHHPNRLIIHSWEFDSPGSLWSSSNILATHTLPQQPFLRSSSPWAIVPAPSAPLPLFSKGFCSVESWITNCSRYIFRAIPAYMNEWQSSSGKLQPVSAWFLQSSGPKAEPVEWTNR